MDWAVAAFAVAVAVIFWGLVALLLTVLEED